ncbi:hypothetical protein [Sinomonas gamaensis]|uniref:hypothetical protein n=1 Tax=Sinomonas gamaensis TaxID=2565624 RepID=UPI001109BEA9|nr:hypothetical protein [Sinomonas gamaensis]
MYEVAVQRRTPRKLLLESRLPRGGPLAWSLAGIAAFTALLLIPRWTGWTLEHLHKEDGQIFLAVYTWTGLGSLIEPYTGYLHAGPRALTAACAQVPTGAFAACIGVGSAGFRMILAVAALAVFMPYSKNWRWALAASALFVAVPVGQQEALGNLTNLRWFCDAAALILLLGAFRRPIPAIGSTLIAAICVLSDPLALVLIPLALWRAATLTGWARVLPIGYLAASIGHIVALQPGARTADIAMYFREPVEMVTQLLVRGPMVAQFGQNATELAIKLVGLPIVTTALILPAIVLVRGTRNLLGDGRLLAIILTLAGLVFLGGTLIFADLEMIRLTEYWTVGQASRYSVLPGILIGQGIILAAANLSRIVFDRLARGITIGVLILAFVADSAGDPWNTRGPTWAETVDKARHECVGRSVARVQMTPTGVPKNWSADIPCRWLTRP